MSCLWISLTSTDQPLPTPARFHPLSFLLPSFRCGPRTQTQSKSQTPLCMTPAKQKVPVPKNARFKVQAPPPSTRSPHQCVPLSFHRHPAYSPSSEYYLTKQPRVVGKNHDSMCCQTVYTPFHLDWRPGIGQTSCQLEMKAAQPMALHFMDHYMSSCPVSTC